MEEDDNLVDLTDPDNRPLGYDIPASPAYTQIQSATEMAEGAYKTAQDAYNEAIMGAGSQSKEVAGDFMRNIGALSAAQSGRSISNLSSQRMIGKTLFSEMQNRIGEAGAQLAAAQAAHSKSMLQAAGMSQAMADAKSTAFFGILDWATVNKVLDNEEQMAAFGFGLSKLMNDPSISADQLLPAATELAAKMRQKSPDTSAA